MPISSLSKMGLVVLSYMVPVTRNNPNILLEGLNSVFFFLDQFATYKARERILRILALSEMQTDAFRIWTWMTKFIFYGDHNNYTVCTSDFKLKISKSKNDPNLSTKYCRFEFSFPSPRVAAIPSLKSLVCPTIYL